MGEDLERERTWLRGMSERAAARRAAESVGRADEEAAARTICPDCPHATHDDLTPPRIWCPVPDCLCAVPPCPSCGAVHKRWSLADGVGPWVCGACGHRHGEWPTAYA